MLIKWKKYPERCVGCKACIVACMDQNDRKPEAGERAFCQIIEKEMENEITWKFQACNHCIRPLCMEACMEGCFFREDGLVLHDPSGCTECGACAEACPFQAITFDRNHHIKKCDSCVERVRAGQLPACVRACPWEAISIEIHS